MFRRKKKSSNKAPDAPAQAPTSATSSPEVAVNKGPGVQSMGADKITFRVTIPPGIKPG